MTTRYAEWKGVDFKSHTATLLNPHTLLWSAPGTRIDQIVYRVFPGLLIVTGDLGDAIYKSSRPASFQAWCVSDFEYFASKCVASEVGQGYRTWDAAWARTIGTVGSDEFWTSVRDLGGLEYMDTQYEWCAWLSEQAFDDPPYDVGTIAHPRCYLQWRGLHLSLQQLCAQEP